MQKMKNYERETYINYNAGENEATVYSAYVPDIRKLDKLVKEKNEATCLSADKYGKSYRIPKSWIKIKPRKELSEEAKKQLRMRILNVSKKAQK